MYYAANTMYIPVCATLQHVFPFLSCLFPLQEQELEVPQPWQPCLLCGEFLDSSHRSSWLSGWMMELSACEQLPLLNEEYRLNTETQWTLTCLLIDCPPEDVPQLNPNEETNLQKSMQSIKEPGPFKVPVKLWRVRVETILPDVRMGPKSYQIICGTKYQYWTIFRSHSVLVMAPT